MVDLHIRQEPRLEQRLVLTPQMLLSLKLLQLTRLELEQRLEQEVEQNPFLELSEPEGTTDTEVPSPSSESQETTEESSNADEASEDASVDASSDSAAETLEEVDVDWDEYYQDADSSYQLREPDQREYDFNRFVSAPEHLIDHLEGQLLLSDLDEKQRSIARYLIGNLNKDGYLEITVEEVAGQLSVSALEVDQVLQVLQSFDPPGIAARNLSEALALQLQRKGHTEPLLFQLIQDDNLRQIARHRFPQLARQLGTSQNEVINAFKIIRQLDPRPARNFSTFPTPYVTPEVSVVKVDDQWLVHLQEGRTSYLRLNPYYQRLLHNGNFSSKEEQAFARKKYQDALWWIRNIEKRKNTLLAIATNIVEHQKEFLEKGIEQLKPLTLRQVAEKVAVDESTVSRITSNKYIETPRGTFPLKFFFSTGLETENGDATSTRSVKRLIQQLVSQESRQCPLTDKQLTELVHEKGIKIARRTVAKYREQLNIPTARLRRPI